MDFVKVETVLEKPIEGLPAFDKLVGKRVELIALDLDSAEPIPEKRVPKFGTAKGTIWMADDFDAPLNEFKDYM